MSPLASQLSGLHPMSFQLRCDEVGAVGTTGIWHLLVYGHLLVRLAHVCLRVMVLEASIIL